MPARSATLRSLSKAVALDVSTARIFFRVFTRTSLISSGATPSRNIERACLLTARRLMEGSSGMNNMVCGHRSPFAFEVKVFAGEDALIILLFAFLLLTDSKLSSDESSPVMEYKSVSSLLLEQVVRFRDELAKVDLRPLGAAVGSASIATTWWPSVLASPVLSQAR